MSSDVLAPAPAVALSPHTLAAALNGGAPADAARAAAAPAARPAFAPLAAVALPGPGDGDEVEETRVGLLLFRVGPELFAAALADVEEAIELPEVMALPEMPAGMLGVVRLRGATMPVFSPARALGVRVGAPLTALVVRDADRRVAIAIDDVEDVIEVRERDIRATPDASGDRLMLGIAHHAGRLVSAIDMGALVAACVTAEEVAA